MWVCVQLEPRSAMHLLVATTDVVQGSMCKLIAHSRSSDGCQVNGVHVYHCIVPAA